MVVTDFFLSSGVDQILILMLFSLCVLWYGDYSWRRRHMYSHASKVHGPPSWPFIGMAYMFWRGSIMDVILQLVDKYPDLFKMWFGPKLMYVTTKPEYIEKIMNSQKTLNKSEFYKPLSLAFGYGLVTAEGDLWRAHRRKINPCFNQTILNRFLEMFTKGSIVFTEQLEKKEGQTSDILETITKCTLDVICETAMGIELNIQTTDNNLFYDLERGSEVVGESIFNFLTYNDYIFSLTPSGRELNMFAGVLHNLSSKVIKERKKIYEERKENRGIASFKETQKKMAFLDWLLECSDFSDQELRDEVEIFILAATDTTATALICSFIMLGMHQDIQQKLYEEAIHVLGPDRDVQFSDISEFKFMERVIKESVRLFPPVPMLGRRVGQDLDLGEVVLPRGSSVTMFVQALHRDEKYWPNPLKFDPDRFLPENVAERQPCSFIPFSFGPRGCVGRRYAMMNMKTILATTIRKFRIFTEYKSVDEIKLKFSISLRLVDGAKVWVEKR